MSEEVNTMNNSEIDEALKEFEAKSNAGQMSKDTFNSAKVYEVPQKDTGDIRFETDSYKTVSSPYKVVVPKMINLIMKLSGGAIKEQKQAEYILAGLALLMFLTSLYFFFR